MVDFNHELAQEYEMNSHINYVDANYETILADSKKTIKYSHYKKDFFNNSHIDFLNFVRLVENGNALEVSGGICGILPLWKSWIKGEKFSIDPLIQKCDDYLKSKGESWFGGINLFPVCAEDFIPELENKIDGFILWHSGLDHMADPSLGLKTVTRYAKPGCFFLLECDIKFPIEPDVGHRNLVEIIPDLRKEVECYGWEYIRGLEYFRDDIKVFSGVFKRK